MSQQVVDLFRNYGYKYNTRQNESKYDIITGTSGGKIALSGTNYVKGHVNHIHVGNYGFTHVKMVKSFSVVERSNQTQTSTAPRGQGGGSFIGWLKSLDAWLEGNSSGPDGH